MKRSEATRNTGNVSEPNANRNLEWVESLVSSTDNQQDRSQVPCAFCGVPFNRENSRVFPFCSVRCQQIDLGMWLDEKFSLPVEGHEDRGEPLDESEFDNDI